MKRRIDLTVFEEIQLPSCSSRVTMVGEEGEEARVEGSRERKGRKRMF